MDKTEFDLYCKAYSSFIADLINNNKKFYRSTRTIKWTFGYDEDCSIMATCNRNTNMITINIMSVMRAYLERDYKVIEYFLLHEIRHAFQNEMIADYKNGADIPITKEIVKQWIYENDHYIKSLDDNGKENPLYFSQDIEIDAYAYSYAVMIYKYGTVDLYVPPAYGSDFYETVDEWIDTFKNEKL